MTQTTNPPPAPVRPSRVSPEQPHDSAEHGIPQNLPTPSGLSIAIAVGAFVILLVILFLIGWIPTHREEANARQEATDRSTRLPVVQVTRPTVSEGAHDVTLPCDIRSNQSTAIFSRTNGYLKKWYFDIGQQVQQGQLLAEIETPEVDAQLEQSKATVAQDQANVKRAEADRDLAQTTLNRYQDSATKSPGSVTQEDLDTKKSALKDSEAAVDQAKSTVKASSADVDRLTTLVGFEKVTAPFSGTVTARNYDVGALLSPSGGKQLFDLDQTDTLRVFVNVPQEYANDLKLQEKAKLYIRNFPTQAFEGSIQRTAGAVDPNTRTLAVQINFDNKDGKLFRGEYGEIHLPVTDAQSVSMIPTSALIFNAQAKGLQVAIVGDGDKVHMKSIKTGRDFGTSIEVTDGIAETDRVVTNPSERVSEGAQVEAHEAPASPKPIPQKST